MRVSIVVPVYNEAATIGAVLDQLAAVDLDKEIIVVDDGSTDGTADLIGRHPATLVRERLELNAGKGAALRHGFAVASGDVVVVQDADLELSPAMIHELVRPIGAGEADVVFGSRFLEDPERVSWHRRLANRVLTSLTNRIYGTSLTDMETAHKAMRRSLLGDLELRSQRFEIEVELTAKLARTGARFLEIPSPYSPRRADEGKKIRWRDGWQALRALWRYRRWTPTGT